jgi:hypothetical protein
VDGDGPGRAQPAVAGGVVSRRRDGKLIAAVVRMARGCASSLAMLVCVDGLASCVTAFVKGFRHKLPCDGRPGRPQLLVEPGLLIGQVIKRYSGRRLVGSNAAGGAGQRLGHRGGAFADGELREVLGARLPPPRWKAPRRKPRRRRATAPPASAIAA